MITRHTIILSVGIAIGGLGTYLYIDTHYRIIDYASRENIARSIIAESHTNVVPEQLLLTGFSYSSGHAYTETKYITLYTYQYYATNLIYYVHTNNTHFVHVPAYEARINEDDTIEGVYLGELYYDGEKEKRKHLKTIR